MTVRLSQKNLFTEKKYDKLEIYSSISYVRENQDAMEFVTRIGNLYFLTSS